MWQAGGDDPGTLLSITQCKYKLAVPTSQGKNNQEKGRAGVIQWGSVLIAFKACVSLRCAELVSTGHPTGTRDGDFDNVVARYAVAAMLARRLSSGAKPNML
ncbi:hypothetical protein COCCADRAFT_22865 [Bipolaris zeicola 26-R-13]|uniref:Uncharacterized protein n=1 Tax=Cochliobolus carbonum (strain 26-R-13) TaxID=930089 RepID=W6YII1_COCC2|nr:uncharacterized protein COCCADRAFT_22865 [Bipolaris zeicola 26-R-13]EUC37488.1 hypothetical protein COCCADRAFT_22865 [Bipolaris zeicola 26-R-13]